MRSLVSSGLFRISDCSALRPSSSRPAWISSAEFMLQKEVPGREAGQAQSHCKRPEPWGSAPFVLFDAVMMNDRRVELPISLLRRVMELDFGKVERDLIRRNHVAIRSTGVITRDEQIAEFDLQVFLLFFAGLAAGEEGLFNMIAGGAGQK